MQKRMVRIAGALLEMTPRQCDPDENGNFGASPAVVKSIVDFLENPSTKPGHGNDDVRAELSRYLAVPADCIRACVDPQRAIEQVARAYLEHDVEALVASPACGDFSTAAQSTGAKVITVDHGNPLDPQIEAVINRIGTRTRAIFVENPSRVSGAFFTEAEIVFLLAYAEGTLVIVDEGCFELGGRNLAELTRKFPNLIVIRRIAGLHGMGPLSMAYILSGPENLQFLDRISAGSCLDGLVFGAARAALATPALIAERIHAINQARRMIKQTLPQVGYEFRLPPGDFLLLLVADIDAAAQYLSNQSIPFCRLPGFDTPRGHLKVYLESPQQAERLLMALSARAGELATGYNRNRSGAENRLKTLDTNMAKVG